MCWILCGLTTTIDVCRHCAFYILSVVFVIVSIPTGTGKTGVLFTSEKRLRQKNKYIYLSLLTECEGRTEE